MSALLELSNVQLDFHKAKSTKRVIDDITFSLQEGEILGIVGESGSGKTMTSLSIMGLLPSSASLTGNIHYKEKNLLSLKEEEYRKIRGKEIAMIFQEPMTSLNPLLTIGEQIEEMLDIHEPVSYKFTKEDEGKKRVFLSMEDAGLKEPDILYKKYPHELSGGMRQRVMIAMAMILRPKILIADEPTTALDVTMQKKILELIQHLNKTYNTSVILISHDLGVIKTICQRALVMKDGKIEEMGNITDLFLNPRKEYTKNLINSMPSMEKGLSIYKKDGREKEAFLPKKENLLLVKDVSVYYKEKPQGIFGKKSKKQAVKQASLQLSQGETLGIVGESGSGKSSLAKAIVGLNKDIEGSIDCNGVKPQMVFQDPYSSLNPVKRIGQILEEPLLLSKIKNKAERQQKIEEVLQEVGLKPEHKNRYPSELSGGQRQRVAIAVALIQNTKLIVLDEPVSALDVTIQAQILTLLKRLQKEHDLSYLFISHDLNVVSQLCNRVCVMHNGEIIESGDLLTIFKNPQKEYTKILLQSVLSS